MLLHFNKVILHNFGSYGHADIDLQNKGFCLVSGENHCKADNAKSNGSGKSFIWSAICFAITGQTIQGLKSNLKNIHAIDDTAYVELDFNADGDNYIVKRILAPKSDLKIEKNNTDVSGKGIRESEAKLAEYLPDLTQDLISSIIILGQGMPNKFSSFKPSGRKELLEKLTKSDFMIEDIKARLEMRHSNLNQQLNDCSLKISAQQAQIDLLNKTLAATNTVLSTRKKPNFDIEIKVLSDEIAKLEAELLTLNTEVNSLNTLAASKQLEFANKQQTQSNTLLELQAQYSAAIKEETNRKAILQHDISITSAELTKLKANPGVCPTCGQKLPNAEHLLVEKQIRENKISELNDKLAKTNKSLTDKEAKYVTYKIDIIDKFNAETADLSDKIKILTENLNLKRQSISKQSSSLTDKKVTLQKVVSARDSWDTDTARYESSVKQCMEEISNLTSKLTELTATKAETESRLTIIKQLENLTRRDFRGYILSDIIKYIDSKAKEYSQLVFGTSDLSLTLDGNDLNIDYAGKAFDNLSGGEKTRVDLILQLAIRDLLTNYLGVSSNILVLDEVTDFLDSVSCDAIMKLVTDKLKDVESVFIVSHHAEELNIPIDSELKVFKNAEGVSSVF